MDLHRNEVKTGLLVIITLSLLVFGLLILGAPGVFYSMNEYKILFDNTAGIKEGASVLLAGRKVGRVTELESPIQSSERPKRGKYEAIVTIKVERDAKVYNHVRVQMRQLGLLGEQVIDFMQGDPTSGLAKSGTLFKGERVPDASEAANLALDAIEPLAKKGTETLEELKLTAENVKRLTAKGSELDRAIITLGNVGRNTKQITDQLLEGDNLRVSLQNIRNMSEDLQSTVVNARQFTDTVKRQPWRLIWPSTKKYPEDEVKEETVFAEESHTHDNDSSSNETTSVFSDKPLNGSIRKVSNNPESR
jgi:phospholipid/cholesterol/gamma-HCH transport system substrate-binding protein